MNQLKQNLWVVVILFTSLATSIALSYAITPLSEVKTIKSEKTIDIGINKYNFNRSLTILLPQVVI